MMTAPIRLSIGHSPDPDDAFMWWPLGGDGMTPEIDTGRFSFTPVPADIEALNRRAVEEGDLDVTALSFHAFASAADRYALTACGASMGDGYGPKVVTRAEGAVGMEELVRPGMRIAVPGTRTTAFLALQMLMLERCGSAERFDPVAMPFHEIVGAVAGGRVDAGVVIHEAQLTYADAGLALAVDLGAWWTTRTGLPLPLGANAVRRDLDARFGAGTCVELAGVLRRSIEHAMGQRERGLAHAQGFAQAGTTGAHVDAFVSMYVNGMTIDAGPRGEAAVCRFFEEAGAAGLIEAPAAQLLAMVRPVAS